MTQLTLNSPEDNEGDQDRITFFADVILPVPIANAFTYRIPEALVKSALLGSRVIVQFGRNKILTGIISKIHNNPPSVYEAKYILEIMDESPIIQNVQISFFQWIANYYMCTTGEVLNAALPSGLKLNSESNVQLRPDFDLDFSLENFNDRELIIINHLINKNTMSYQEIATILDIKSIYPLINSLIKKEAIILFEKIIEKYKPKKISKFRLTQPYIDNQELLEKLFEDLEKHPKQIDVIMKYLQEIPIYQHPEKNLRGLSKSVISKGNFSMSSLNTLIKNQVFESFDEIISRFDEIDVNPDLSQIHLSEEQQAAKNQLLKIYENHDIALLHGITGSGKTEIYIDLIQSNLDGGHQVLYLLPEIALTTQIVKRLMKVFGSKMGVYHSKYSDNERVEVWQGVLSGNYAFVVGVRSAVFLPFSDLGLIIVDEEHETSFKQFEPAPRYHARDLALILARYHYGKVLLGTATPAIETYFQARQEKYGLVVLNQRYNESELPEFTIVDTLQERRKKRMKEDFSAQLLEAIQQALHKKEQVIIFQNRRGYAPYMVCDQCNWIPKCENCAVSLTYHMYLNQLRCHYCGHKEKPAGICPACGSTKMTTVGFGTEKLEEDLKTFFPKARIQRMDLDTTRSKYSYQNIINDFERGETDILVGTQMLSKGLDFDNVNLVGIVDIDRMIHFPDFRAAERTFQLVTQVSGRAGRRKKSGKVIIQTGQPNHPLINKIINHDYIRMYEDELKERRQFKYPPFVRITTLTLKHKDKNICLNATRYLVNLLSQHLGEGRIYGPTEPVISKIRNHFLFEILVKIEREGVNLQKAKAILKGDIVATEAHKQFKGIRIIVNVDSY